MTNTTKRDEYRVITWTKRDGVTGSTDSMSRAEADALCAQLREANPAWLHVEIERA